MSMASGMVSSAVSPLEKEKCPTRAVIRGLPPDMTKDTLLEVLIPRPDFNHFYFIDFKIEDGLFKLPRAYMNFNTNDDLIKFINDFDYKLIMGNDGMRYKIYVEAAPNQRLALNKRRRIDLKMGTIEQDKYYQYFLHKLQSKENCPNAHINYDFYSKKNDMHKMTPLLMYVMERKSRREIRPKSDGIIFVNSMKKKPKSRMREYAAKII